MNFFMSLSKTFKQNPQQITVIVIGAFLQVRVHELSIEHGSVTGFGIGSSQIIIIIISRAIILTTTIIIILMIVFAIIIIYLFN